MSPLGIAVAIGASWLIVASLGAAGWSFAVTRIKRAATVTAERVHWMPFLPPVPPVRDPLDDLPADVLTDDEVAARFARIVDGAR